jgi:hypothetical protein
VKVSVDGDTQVLTDLTGEKFGQPVVFPRSSQVGPTNDVVLRANPSGGDLVRPSRAIRSRISFLH